MRPSRVKYFQIIRDQTYMPIASIKFQNFRVFRKATLPLGRTTLIVGPNGSGKTTALQAVRYLGLASSPQHWNLLPQADSVRSIGTPSSEPISLEVKSDAGRTASVSWSVNPNLRIAATTGDIRQLTALQNARIYAFQHEAIAAQVPLVQSAQISESGQGLPAVLTNLQDHYPERFEALNKDLGSWLPEFDRVLLDTTANGQRALMLRTRLGSHRILSHDLSQGSLFALVLLTLSHLPNPPCIVALEDPDRGMHPRLLRDILDATERLANPQVFNDSRPPVQVVMTTHSPLLVDLFRDRPEDVVLIDKKELWSEFRKLSEIPNVDEILSGAHLGEAWFSGSLGGVPVNS
jgi:predicted ATPase